MLGLKFILSDDHFGLRVASSSRATFCGSGGNFIRRKNGYTNILALDDTLDLGKVRLTTRRRFVDRNRTPRST